MRLSGVVVNALTFGPRGPGFTSRQCHWVATSGKLFTHIASQSSQLQETAGYKREYSDWTDLTG